MSELAATQERQACRHCDGTGHEPPPAPPPVWDMSYQPIVAAEIEAARVRGEPWTGYRPFVSFEEQVGAMACGCRSKRSSKRKLSVVVSYATFLAGRTVLCADCAAERGIAHQPLPWTNDWGS